MTSPLTIAKQRQPTANELFWPAANDQGRNATPRKLATVAAVVRVVAACIAVERVGAVLKASAR